jgi:hypothetical protein
MIWARLLLKASLAFCAVLARLAACYLAAHISMFARALPKRKSPPARAKLLWPSRLCWTKPRSKRANQTNGALMTPRQNPRSAGMLQCRTTDLPKTRRT